MVIDIRFHIRLEFIKIDRKLAKLGRACDVRIDGHTEIIKVSFLAFWLQNPKNHLPLIGYPL